MKETLILKSLADLPGGMLAIPGIIQDRPRGGPEFDPGRGTRSFEFGSHNPLPGQNKQEQDAHTGFGSPFRTLTPWPRGGLNE